jgi:hypothetical protein
MFRIGESDDSSSVVGFEFVHHDQVDSEYGLGIGNREQTGVKYSILETRSLA